MTLEPLRLLDEIRVVQRHIAGRARGEVVHVPSHRDMNLENFLRSLETLWRQGEARPTHQAVSRPERHWRTRKDPFEDVWPKFVLWLNASPEQTATELMLRLQQERPGELESGQLRTLQRRVRLWRRAAAQRLLFGGD